MATISKVDALARLTTLIEGQSLVAGTASSVEMMTSLSISKFQNLENPGSRCFGQIQDSVIFSRLVSQCQRRFEMTVMGSKVVVKTL